MFACIVRSYCWISYALSLNKLGISRTDSNVKYKRWTIIYKKEGKSKYFFFITLTVGNQQALLNSGLKSLLYPTAIWSENVKGLLAQIFKGLLSYISSGAHKLKSSQCLVSSLALIMCFPSLYDCSFCDNDTWKHCTMSPAVFLVVRNSISIWLTQYNSSRCIE